MHIEEFHLEPFLDGHSFLILSLDVRLPSPVHFGGPSLESHLPSLEGPKLDTALDVSHLC